MRSFLRGKVSEEYDEMIGDELDCDGIEIDWHLNPRPSHEFMQGKQYVLGKARKIDGVLFESADEALNALGDYGCRHYKTSIICGVSAPRYDPKELAELNERNKRKYKIGDKEYTGYEATQMMRKLERETRKINKEKVLAKASGDNVLLKDCNAKIRAYRAKYDRICEATGFTPEYGRMTITRNSKSVLQNSENGGIIKEGNKNAFTLITENAINKIQKVNIDGFTDEQNTYIQKQHKELLRYAKDKNDSKEVAFVFRDGLKDKSVFTGGENVIDFGNGLSGKGTNLFVMHNHPKNSGFSSSDIAQLIVEDNISNMSLVTNYGKIEVIAKTIAYDKRKAVIEWNRVIKNIVKGTDTEYENAMKQLLKKLDKGGNIRWIK